MNLWQLVNLSLEERTVSVTWTIEQDLIMLEFIRAIVAEAHMTGAFREDLIKALELITVESLLNVNTGRFAPLINMAPNNEG